MPFTRVACTPTDGLNNSTSFPTNPVSEVAARKQVQDVIDQVVTGVNLLENQLEATAGAGKIGCTGATSNIQAFITATEAAGSGTTPGAGVITNAMMVTDAKIGSLAAYTGTVKTDIIAICNEILSKFLDTRYIIPVGVIVEWHGLISAIPSGWVLCDGTNGTPNLADKFIMGTSTPATIGTTGGSNSTTLTTTQLPAHDHTASSGTESATHTHGFTTYSGNNAGPSYIGQVGGTLSSPTAQTTGTESATHNHAVTVESSGTGAAYDSRPAYYALSFIMKT
jgi:microcystin-dependent protein